MRHNIGIKFLVFFLTACSFVTAVSGGAAIVAIESAGLYVNSLDELQDQQYESIGQSVAVSYAERYVADNFSNLSYIMKDKTYSDPAERADAKYWTIKLEQGDSLLEAPGSVTDYPVIRQYTVAPIYPLISYDAPRESGTSSADDAIATTAPEAVTTPTIAPESTATGSLPTGSMAKSSARQEVTIPDDYLYVEECVEWDSLYPYHYYLYYYQAPTYTVTVYMQPEVLESSSLHILTSIYPYRHTAIFILAAGLSLFAAGMVFLFWSAGRSRGGEIHPGGLNRLPLDVYAAIAGVGIFLLVYLFVGLCDWIDNEGPHLGNLSLLALNLLVITLLGIGLLFAFAAQIKMKGGYWWKHSVIGCCLSKLWSGIRFLSRSFHAFVRMLPVIWQWLLTAALMVAGTAIAFLLFLINIDNTISEIFFFLVLLAAVAACIGIVCYGGYAFGTLLVGARKMTQGNLSYQIPTKYLTGSFLDFANQLNALSETAMLSAKKHLKSEQMKTELITNVSHDIKTPLTSIINFVDLLQKPHTEDENKQYLEVLARQSAQMKKLIEDLMELSKANTGNMTVNISQLDAAETINQALGEFADKLDSAKLTPVFRQPAEPVHIAADGRLTWRVLSNLLSNAVKYALPGTRLYVDLLEIDSQVCISLKNISREELQVSAEELMERFVQGDASRNTEGSGLGLNIAQSLMEVQHGQLQLLLDGDLFKVTLIFPKA